MFRVARLQCACCAWGISQVTPLWLLQRPLQGQLSLVPSPSGLSGCTGAAVAIDMPMTAVSVMAYLGVVLAGCVVVSIADSFSPAQIQTRCLLARPSNHPVASRIRLSNAWHKSVTGTAADDLLAGDLHTGQGPEMRCCTPRQHRARACSQRHKLLHENACTLALTGW